MIDAGIYPGAILIVDRAIEADDGDIVIARLNDELCVKRLRITDGRVSLHSENHLYKPIEITEEIDFEIWGRVMHSIQSH